MCSMYDDAYKKILAHSARSIVRVAHPYVWKES